MKPCPACSKGVKIEIAEHRGTTTLTVVHRVPSLCGGISTAFQTRARKLDGSVIGGFERELRRAWQRGSW